MRYFIILGMLALTLTSAYAQRWTNVKESTIIKQGQRDIIPEIYRIVQVNDKSIKDILWQAPNASYILPKNSEIIISIPNQSGKELQFKISEYNTKEPLLAAKFPDIKSFIGVEISDPLITLRADYTVHGLRAVIDNRGEKTFIDHYQRNDREHKIIYLKKDFRSNNDFTCNVLDAKGIDAQQEKTVSTGDCNLKLYQLAISATSSYTGHHGATSAAQANLVMSAIETSINRINGVYEREVGSRFILVNETEDLWFYNYNSDPFGGSAGNPPSINSAMLNTNKTVTDNEIGFANYDIGHVYTGGFNSGLAQLPAICLNGKARGATGREAPVGDPFDVDYVAHEMGHQFGGSHTQNNDCNRSNATAVEPGSGSSIMGYAGICSPNVANNSHDNFHATSIAEMKNHIDSQNCHTIIPSSNNAPIVNAVLDKTLPISTPFVLTGVASDQDGDPMLYTWDQTNNEIATMPPQSTNADGPAFRARPVTANPSRYFPRLEDLAPGNATTWEVLPSVSRTMDFRFTARDSEVGVGGCTSETDVELTFTNVAGPFEATYPNGGETFVHNASTTVTWNKAGTDIAPISCSNVDILLSIDGGLSFPTVLATNTANDGTQGVTIPAINTATARIMVICSDNYFFDISDNNFTISDGTTEKCRSIASAEIPVTIPTIGSVSSELTIRDRGNLSDLNMFDLTGNHTYLEDLSFDLTNGLGNTATILNFTCVANNTFDVNLDDAAASSTLPCPPNDGMTYKPLNSLIGLSGEFQGTWTLTINDAFNPDGGELSSWALEYCALDLCDLTVDQATYAGEGSISQAIECAIAGDTIWLENTINGNTISTLNNTLVIDKDITIVGDVMTTLLSTDPAGTLTIASGHDVSLIGITVANTNNVAINNNGNLILQDMNVTTNGTSDEILNGATGTITVKGECNIQE